MNYISHISNELSLTECELFIKAVSTKGVEATGALWLDWWFTYKADPNNIIQEDFKKRMVEAAEKNMQRIGSALYSIK